MITAAAIKLKDGRIFTSHRHHNVMAEMFHDHGITKAEMRGHEQGFVDEHRKFYDRIEAGKHAEACGQVEPDCAQIRHKYNPRLGLFSEDLW